jgi:hypothetical protein
MKDLKFYADITENGKLSTGKLKNYLESYAKEAKNILDDIRQTKDLEGDDFADEFFNNLDEETLMEFTSNDEKVALLLGRYRDDLGEQDEFDVCYIIEQRNLNDELKDMDSWELGEEEAIIDELKRLSYERKAE